MQTVESDPKGAAAFRQEVSLKLEVLVTGTHADFDFDESILRQLIERLVIDRLPDALRLATSDGPSADHFASSTRYFYPGEEVVTRAITPITISLADLVARR